jgi:molybdopterin molybdotransferase
VLGVTASGLLEIEDARRIVLSHANPLPSQQVRLVEALGRVLAGDIVAAQPVPAFDSSAMDGFAVSSRDMNGASPQRPLLLRVIDESRAGAPARRRLADREAIAISTGAQVPPGADAVVRVEDTRAAGEDVEVLRAVAAGSDVRRAGEDMRPGQTVLERGRSIGAAELGVLASLGRAEVSCVRRPRLSLLVSGDELLAPGEPMRPGGVRDSNSLTISALARRAGADVVSSERVRDEAAATRDAIAAAIERADVAVICGGVSVGSHDHVKGALRELGSRELFWGIALRPGKPTWFGTSGSTLVLGLPGNPVSAMVTFMLLARPALRALQDAQDVGHRASALMARDYVKPAGRAHALRCRLKPTPQGWLAEPNGEQGSHILTSMLDADALAIVPSGVERVAAGERVEIELLREAWEDLA